MLNKHVDKLLFFSEVFVMFLTNEFGNIDFHNYLSVVGTSFMGTVNVTAN